MEEVPDKTETEYKIISEIYKAFEKLGGDSMILGIIGSWGDDNNDVDTLDLLEGYNGDGFEIIASVDPSKNNPSNN